MTTHRIRVGIDVGGTFTDAVAVDATTLRLVGQVKSPRATITRTVSHTASSRRSTGC